jgi:hypothetical protein
MKKRHSAEQIVGLLRQADVALLAVHVRVRDSGSVGRKPDDDGAKQTIEA